MPNEVKRKRASERAREEARWSTGQKAAFGIALVGLAVAVLWGVIKVVAPQNRQVNEDEASRTLRKLNSLQVLFRQDDLDRDKKPDYATLADLARLGLIDDALASGTRSGYTFRCQPSPTNPELWMATAGPVAPGRSGERWFMVNREGVVFFSKEGPAEITPDCAIPPNWKPRGL